MIDSRTTNCERLISLSTRLSDSNALRLRQAMIDEFDLDQDGEINEQEFIAIMTED